ncbi:hypothetical protein [Nocardioides sp. Iso805N]|uniref:hypothetical protein n=1 Tax=Nocardioides sp. Iso805N TaxID=1283287 RepID=UPI00036834EB|nr:hypothetical protein [Nocardioides sp. Iso805N]
MAVSGASTEKTLLATTGAFAVAYLIATAAAVRLLPRGSWGWWAASVSTLASVGLVIATGWAVAVPLAVGLAGAIWAWLRNRAPAAPLPPASPPGLG